MYFSFTTIYFRVIYFSFIIDQTYMKNDNFNLLKRNQKIETLTRAKYLFRHLEASIELCTNTFKTLLSISSVCLHIQMVHWHRKLFSSTRKTKMYLMIR